MRRRVSDYLASNQVVGSSNLSGRALDAVADVRVTTAE